MIDVIKHKIRRRYERIRNITTQRKSNLFSVFFRILKLQFRRGFNFVEIHDNELDLRDKEYEESFLNWKEQKKCLEILNPRKYYSLARNKYLTHVILDRLEIQEKARLLCYYNPAFGKTCDNISNNIQSTIDILKRSEITQFVIKTTESSHGDNVWVIKDADFATIIGDVKLSKFDGSEVLLSDILRKEPLIFETVIKQTEQLSSLNPSSVNTVRFMTVLMPNGKADTIACFIKIGRAGSCVDNAGCGGNIDAGIDIETGQLFNPIMFNGWRKINKITQHPDSKAQLDGLIIKDWQNIRNKVEDFQSKMPYVKAAGWDIAITDDGPVIIEINDMWDRTGQLFLGHGWKKEITKCYEAWLKYYSSK